jgi:hypothetical protein
LKKNFRQDSREPGATTNACVDYPFTPLKGVFRPENQSKAEYRQIIKKTAIWSK